MFDCDQTFLPQCASWRLVTAMPSRLVNLGILVSYQSEDYGGTMLRSCPCILHPPCHLFLETRECFQAEQEQQLVHHGMPERFALWHPWSRRCLSTVHTSSTTITRLRAELHCCCPREAVRDSLPQPVSLLLGYEAGHSGLSARSGSTVTIQYI